MAVIRRWSLGDWTLLVPIILFQSLFFVAPLFLLLALSFTDAGRLSLAQYHRFFMQSGNLNILLDTLLLGVKVVFLTTLLGYPIGLLFMVLGPAGRRIIVFLAILPMLTSKVVQTLAWIVILGREGLINNTLVGLGLAESSVRLMYTEPALVLALAQIELPLLVLPLIAVLARIDNSLWEASISLGMDAWRSLFRIVVPLSLPGLFTGWILVFASSSMNFVTQAVVGGARLIYLPQLVYQEMTTLYNWPFAASIAMVMIGSVGLVLTMLILVRRDRRINIYA